MNDLNLYHQQSEVIISFSGGRTSGMMLKKIIDAHDGILPEHVKVVFCNTGLERNETLDFVQECSDRWNVPIVWLEFVTAERSKDRWKVVDYATASRDGEPFESLIVNHKKYLPNPVTRFCTIELKIRVAKHYAQQVLGWKHWDVAVGFRADEWSRVAKLSLPNKEPFERFAPLAMDGVTVQDVSHFWQEQGFDLALPNVGGKTPHGNCTLCFLKGEQTTLRLIAETPDAADFYIRMESLVAGSGITKGDGALFRKDRPSYKSLKNIAVNQSDFFEFDDAIECIGCTD